MVRGLDLNGANQLAVALFKQTGAGRYCSLLLKYIQGSQVQFGSATELLVFAAYTDRISPVRIVEDPFMPAYASETREQFQARQRERLAPRWVLFSLSQRRGLERLSGLLPTKMDARSVVYTILDHPDGARVGLQQALQTLADDQ